MIFTETEIEGVLIVDLEKRGDDRGFFARAYCADEFSAQGLVAPVAQANLAWTAEKGTVRGIHWQEAPHAEAKFSRCVRGEILDVAVDVRPDSPTYLSHVGVRLTAENRRALYIAPGIARAYQTLTDDSELLYMVSEAYAPDAERGLRPNDPALGIGWPVEVSQLSDKDGAWPLLKI